jgi:hypothetical protein
LDYVVGILGMEGQETIRISGARERKVVLRWLEVKYLFGSLGSLDKGATPLYSNRLIQIET